MFLPVLLWRDYGPWSFAVFAVPNVLGAAAMGWVLRRPGTSERLVTGHRGACEAFSVVTRAFQYFFLVWLVTSLESRAPAIGAIGGAAAGALLGLRPYSGRRAVLVAALAVCVISYVLLAAAGAANGLRPPSPPPVPLGGLAWLAPVCAFGFILCPYLDLSFHHARQQNPGMPGTAGFVLGFGVLFLALVLGTVFYAWMFLDPAGLFASEALRTTAGVLVCGHIGLQLGYTIELHKARVVPADGAGAVAESGGLPWAALGIAAGIASALLPPYAGLSAGELIYRGFMGSYGLVFPAYVWLCIVPTRGSGDSPSRAALLIWAGSVAVAGPMFWMGFVERQSVWLGPGLAVVLFARFAVIGASRRV